MTQDVPSESAGSASRGLGLHHALIGLLPVVAVRVVAEFEREELAPFVLVVAILVTAWMIAYPLWLRRRGLLPPGTRLDARGVLVEGLLAGPVGFGLLVVVALTSLYVQSSFELPEYDSGLQGLAESAPPEVFAALAFLAVVIAPISEELFFREFLFRTLRASWGGPVAGILQAALFAGLHSFLGLQGLVYYFLVGSALLLVLRWRRTLAAPMLVHAVFNALVLAAVLSASLVPRPFLGVRGEPGGSGCTVAEVVEDSPAERAGLRAGDRIVVVGDDDVDDFEELRRALLAYRSGESVRIEFERDGELRVVDVELGDPPDAASVEEPGSSR